jgi:hypothetical protein
MTVNPTKPKKEHVRRYAGMIFTMRFLLWSVGTVAVID